MDAVERLKKYENADFDTIILMIKNGTIKCGRYAQKIKDDSKIGKELFGKDDSK